MEEKGTMIEALYADGQFVRLSEYLNKYAGRV